MNYEKTILELLERIQILEEQVSKLTSYQESAKERETNKMNTKAIKAYIEEQKCIAKESGKTELILRSGDVHNDLGLKQRHPQVCNAMRQCMNNADVVLYQPPKGNGTTLQISYKL